MKKYFSIFLLLAVMMIGSQTYAGAFGSDSLTDNGSVVTIEDSLDESSEENTDVLGWVFSLLNGAFGSDS